MRVDELHEQLGDAIDVEWRSFLLRAEPKTGDRAKFVEYTKSWLRPAETEPRATFNVWSSDAPQPSSSIPAQVAYKVLAAGWPDQASAYHRRLLEAYFGENRDISDVAELKALASEVGIDGDAFAAAVAHDEHEVVQQVITEHNAAIQSEITAVPTVVFANAFGVPGAQPTETYARIVERINERRAG